MKGRKGGWTIRRRRPLPLGQVSGLCRQLAGFLSTGVPLVQALAILEKTPDLPRASRRACHALAAQLRHGVLLPDAMQRLHPLFPGTLVAAVRGADGHGHLAAALLRMGRQYDRRWMQRQQMRAGMAYPAFLSCMVFGVAWLAVGWLLPQLTPLLTELDSLPAATRALLAGESLLHHHGGTMAAALVVIALSVHILMRYTGVRVVCDRLCLHLPFMGRSQRQIATARFARTLADLYACGVPITEAAALAAQTTGNRWIQRQVDAAIRRIAAGEDWALAIGRVDGFMPQLRLCLQIGSQAGNLREQLEVTADVLDQENSLTTKQMLGLLEPLSTLVLGVLVGLLMMAVLLPLYAYYDTLWTVY